MSLTEIDAPGDLELLRRVHDGDLDAYGDLFERHVDAARRLAGRLAGPARADEIASEAFDRVHRAIQGGKGPTEAFRAYLLTTVRRTAWRHGERQVREQSLDEDPERDETLMGLAPPSDLSAEERVEHERAVEAFRSLPERWQLVLWHTLVEEQSPAEIAPIIGISPNATAALALRAREGLRDAYLQTHVEHEAGPDCRFTTERLGALVRDRLSKRDTRKVEAHLAGCERCRATRDEVADVGMALRSVIGPAVLGIPTAEYLRSGTGGASSAGGSVSTAADPAAHSSTIRRLLVGGGALALVAGGLALIMPSDETEPDADRTAADGTAEGVGGATRGTEDPVAPTAELLTPVAADECTGTLFTLDLPPGTEVVEARAMPAEGEGAAPALPTSDGLVTQVLGGLDPGFDSVDLGPGLQVTGAAVCATPDVLAGGGGGSEDADLILTLVDETGTTLHAVVPQVVTQVESVLTTVEALAEAIRAAGQDALTGRAGGGQVPGAEVPLPDVLPTPGGGSGPGGSTLPGISVPQLTAPVPGITLPGMTTPDGQG